LSGELHARVIVESHPPAAGDLAEVIRRINIRARPGSPSPRSQLMSIVVDSLKRTFCPPTLCQPDRSIDHQADLWITADRRSVAHHDDRCPSGGNWVMPTQISSLIICSWRGSISRRPGDSQRGRFVN
jgi:hypothetical protein